ncbi:MAG: cation transporter [Rhodovulum sulfidophilum]|uniref:Cation transporter n=1 Tax=Rhodovulum sulfidophilum TaxID=35806 RepID=A0A2W5QJQ6_RHOSU|nr:MAG: cation transporter [Rhodovulum sulfidophilum]
MHDHEHDPHHGHGPDHGHGGAGGHAHGHHHAADSKALGTVALMTGGFLVIEALGGWISGSLALIADAGHMLTDFAALVMAWAAIRMARRPPDARRTYGFDRVAVLAAFVNGLALFLIAIWIAFEAWDRIAAPAPVEGGLMLTVATLGLVVNIVAFRILTRGERANLNMRAAILHVAGDLLGSVAAIVAALVILASGWTPIDPILSVLVAVLILRSAFMVVRDSARILLEASPVGFDPAAVASDLTAAIPGLAAVRHLHAWSISEERPMATLEAVVAPGADAAAIRRAIKARLAERFGIDHATVEIHDELFPDPSARLPDEPPASI